MNLHLRNDVRQIYNIYMKIPPFDSLHCGARSGSPQILGHEGGAVYTVASCSDGTPFTCQNGGFKKCLLHTPLLEFKSRFFLPNI